MKTANFGSGNLQATQNGINNDFAMVGSFSLQDNYGGSLLKKNPGMPDVSVVLDPATNKLPNVYSDRRAALIIVAGSLAALAMMWQRQREGR